MQRAAFCSLVAAAAYWEDVAVYGGMFCDIGSHQIDQFCTPS